MVYLVAVHKLSSRCIYSVLSFRSRGVVVISHEEEHAFVDRPADSGTEDLTRQTQGGAIEETHDAALLPDSDSCTLQTGVLMLVTHLNLSFENVEWMGGESGNSTSSCRRKSMDNR